MRIRPAAVLAVAVLAAVVLAGGCSDTPVRIGALISRTGAAAPYGERVRRGLDLALERTNAEGGVHGRRVEIVYEDDATNPEVGMQRAREMIQREHVRVIVGAVSSAVTLRLAELCERTRVVLLSPTASAPRLSEAGAYVFRVFPSETLEATAMADFARDLGFQRIAVIAARGDYGLGLEGAFVARYEGGARRILASASFEEGDASGLADAARRTAALQPQLVYLAAYADDTVSLARHLREAGFDGLLLASSSVPAQPLAAAGGRCVIPASGFDPDEDDPAALDFAARFQDRFGEFPDGYAAQGYDALRVLVLAMRRAKSLDADSIRRTLLSVADYNGPSGRIAFDPKGDVLRYPRLYVIDGGRPIPYDRYVESGGELEARGR